MKSTTKRILLGAFATVFLGVASPAQSDDWEWVVAPYLWASDVGMDLTVNDNISIGGEAAFKDLLDKVDSVFMGHFEGRRGKWGMYLDTIYLDLSDNNTVSVGPGGPILGDLSTEAGLKMKLYDAGALYRMSEPGSDLNFDLMAGARYIDLSVKTLVTLPGPMGNQIDIRTGPSETDLMLGARLIGKFSQRWGWMLHGDLSFGGSEGTYNGIATVKYTFGETGLFTLAAGYRYMSIEMEGSTPTGGSTDSDISMSGPLLGFLFNF